MASSKRLLQVLGQFTVDEVEDDSGHVIKGGSFLCAENYCMRYRAGARQSQKNDLAVSHLGCRTIAIDGKS